MKGNPTRVNRLKNEADLLLRLSPTTHGFARTLRGFIKEAGLYENYWISSRKWAKRKIDSNTERIQIGGGKHMLSGFFNIDLTPPADLVWDIREGIPLEDGCSNFIFSEHFLEHIDYPTSVKRFVNESYRILSSGGQIVTGVPDSEFMIKMYMKKDKRFFQKMINSWYQNRNCLEHVNTYIDLLNYHFRDQDDDEKYNPHLWAYDFEKLKSLFLNAGFSKVKKWKFDKSFANPTREWGSLYVVATK